MGELAKVDPVKVELAKWATTVYGSDKALWGAVKLALTLCQMAGLPCAKEVRPDLSDRATIALYVFDASRAGLTAEDIGADCHDARSAFEWFPSSSEFVRIHLGLKRIRVPLISEPCYVVNERGGVFLACHRRLAPGAVAFDTEAEALVRAAEIVAGLPVLEPGKCMRCRVAEATKAWNKRGLMVCEGCFTEMSEKFGARWAAYGRGFV